MEKKICKTFLNAEGIPFYCKVYTVEDKEYCEECVLKNVKDVPSGAAGEDGSS